MLHNEEHGDVPGAVQRAAKVAWVAGAAPTNSRLRAAWDRVTLEPGQQRHDYQPSDEPRQPHRTAHLLLDGRGLTKSCPILGAEWERRDAVRCVQKRPPCPAERL